MTKEEIKKYLMNMREAIIVLEKELCEDISEDGTLTVNVEDGSKVSRVLVCGDNHFGGLYYPEQEPCEDAISMDKTIVQLSHLLSDWDDDWNVAIRKCIETVKNVPPVTPQYTEAEIQKMQDLEFAEIQKAYEIGKAEGNSENPNKWIPVSERLPEDGLYLVTTSKGQVQVHVFNHNGNSEEYWMRCNKAWMPLPEPFEGNTK